MASYSRQLLSLCLELCLIMEVIFSEVFKLVCLPNIGEVWPATVDSGYIYVLNCV